MAVPSANGTSNEVDEQLTAAPPTDMAHVEQTHQEAPAATRRPASTKRPRAAALLEDNDEGVERVWHRVEMIPAQPSVDASPTFGGGDSDDSDDSASRGTHESASSDDSDDTGMPTDTMSQVHMLIHELRNECERSQHQVLTLQKRLLESMPDA
ncbi:hypothetical protein As57867_016223, partial [Aphanomyces stellatus]